MFGRLLEMSVDICNRKKRTICIENTIHYAFQCSWAKGMLTYTDPMYAKRTHFWHMCGYWQSMGTLDVGTTHIFCLVCFIFFYVALACILMQTWAVQIMKIWSSQQTVLLLMATKFSVMTIQQGKKNRTMFFFK